MRKTVAMALGLVLFAGSALASNTGFKLNYTLYKPAGRTGNNWIAPPYFYFPNGNVSTVGAQNSVDFCSDLNEGVAGSKVKTIFRYDTATDTAKTQSCSSTIKVFDLVVGQGYSLIPANDNVTVNIVGSHDDAYAKNKTATPTLYNLLKPTGRTGNNWFSVPYHSIANNAVDLCADLNDNVTASKVKTIFRYDPTTDTAKTQSCSSTIKVFDLKPGEGYSLIPANDNTGVSVSVY